MKINTIQPILNLQSFYDFVKLTKNMQSEVLHEYGTILDLDSEKTTYTKLYFLHGFFVEEIIDRKDNSLIEIIPYKQGYRIENYVDVKRNLN
jgi:hypothetical protein